MVVSFICGGNQSTQRKSCSAALVTKKDSQYNGQKKDSQYNGQKKDSQYNGQKKDSKYNGQKKDSQYNGQKKDSQYNGHKKKDKNTQKYDPQNTTQKTKGWVTRTHKNTGVISTLWNGKQFLLQQCNKSYN